MNSKRIVAAIRRPESAAIAGLAFAAILGFTLILLHNAAVGQTRIGDAWLSDPARRAAVNLAVTLLPFAGIAFLWFIAVIRAHLGSRDDRFFETVFLGSGLIFVASMFTAAAAFTAVLRLDTPDGPLDPDTVAFAPTFAAAALGVFGAKMAAVFMFSAATAGMRAKSLPRWLGLIGFVAGVCMLFIPPLPPIAQFLFPLWVAMVSVLVLVRRRRSPQEDVII